MRFDATVLALALALSVAPGRSPAAPAASPPTVDEIVARYVAAHGGADRMAALHSLRVTGKLVVNGGSIEAAYAQVVKRPAMVRSELTLQGLSVVNAYDGQVGWSVNPFGGRRDPEQQSADDVKSLAQQADIDGPLVDWRAKGHKVEYLGSEDVDGTPAHKLRVELKDGDTQYYYLDPDYYLEIRVETVSRVRGAEQVRVSDLGSYEQVDGVWMPFSIESGSKGEPPSSFLTIETAEPNVEVDDAIFHFPAAGTPVTRMVVAAPGAADKVWPSTAPAAANLTPPVVDSAAISGLGARNIGSAAMSGRIAAVAGAQRRRQDDTVRGRGERRRVEVARRRHHLQAGLRQAAGAVDRRRRHRSLERQDGVGGHRRVVDAQLGLGRRRHLQVHRRRRDLVEHGPARVRAHHAHPRRTRKDSDIVYACVPGKLWSDSAERGLYKTTDGGKTWTLMLKGANLSTGCSGLTMDPGEPR